MYSQSVHIVSLDVHSYSQSHVQEGLRGLCSGGPPAIHKAFMHCGVHSHVNMYVQLFAKGCVTR
jgi:hypothetical protein